MEIEKHPIFSDRYSVGIDSYQEHVFIAGAFALADGFKNRRLKRKLGNMPAVYPQFITVTQKQMNIIFEHLVILELELEQNKLPSMEPLTSMKDQIRDVVVQPL